MIGFGELTFGILILTRVSAFLTAFPLFARRQLPRMVKVGIALSLTLFWLSTYDSTVGAAMANLSAIQACLLLGKEAVIGFFLAFTMGLFFWPIRIAGSYIGTELGLSMAAINDPSSQESSTVVSAILEAFTVLMFFMLNMHHFFLLALNESFLSFNALEFMQLPYEDIVLAVNDIHERGLTLGAPVIIVLGGISLGISFLVKAAPTFNLFTVGLPIRLFAGLLSLFLLSGIVMNAAAAYFDRARGDILELISFLF